MMTMMAMTPTPQILTAGVHSPCQHGAAACHCPGRQVGLSKPTIYLYICRAVNLETRARISITSILFQNQIILADIVYPQTISK